jgi:hypothetical protein
VSLLATSLLLLAITQQPSTPSAGPAVQRPTAPATTPAPVRAPATAPAPATVPATAPATIVAPSVDVAAQPPVPPVPQDTPVVATATPPEVGPPFYTPADMQALRQRHGLEADPPTIERKPKFRCWVADPTCGFVIELNATSAYAMRVRQGSVNQANDFARWNSARVQYDVWFSIPTMVETRGKFRYTRLSLGPKGGVVASDNKDIWGNVGIAGRYWFSRKRFAPALEFTSALVFKVAGINRAGNFDNVRGPMGFTADIGFGIGGFGSLIVGGQFDSPLAREDVPDVERVSAAGMFFLGFRGNIVWGAPAAIAVGTHAAANRSVRSP